LSEQHQATANSDAPASQENHILGRPPRNDAADPPGGCGDASVATRLTKLGIEVPGPTRSNASDDFDRAVLASSGASNAGRSTSGNVSIGRKAAPSTVPGPVEAKQSFPGSITSSLNKFGIAVPSYNNSDAKKSDVSSEASQASQASKQSKTSKQSQASHHSAAMMESPSDPAVQSISMSGSDDGSSVLRDEESKVGGLARQQLVAELREATNLMAESRTPEAAKFWEEHVHELEARLKALDNGEDASASSDSLKKHSSYQEKSETKTFLQSQSHQSRAGETFHDEAPENDHLGQYDGTSDDMQNAIEMNSTRTGHQPLMMDPSLHGVPMVDVVAPADLPGGYHFEAEIEGRRFLATVPNGGVQKGETFSCYMRDLEKVGSDIPVGRWRDSLFDCFKFGCCHGVVCNTLFCPLGMSTRKELGCDLGTF